jgi:hypothetical protein
MSVGLTRDQIREIRRRALAEGVPPEKLKTYQGLMELAKKYGILPQEGKAEGLTREQIREIWRRARAEGVPSEKLKTREGLIELAKKYGMLKQPKEMRYV